jgi:hypothetical protein
MTEREQHPMTSDEELFANHPATQEMEQRSAAALHELTELVTANIETAGNLQRLKEFASCIGSHLLTLVKVHGTLQELDFGYRKTGADLASSPETAVVLRQPTTNETEIILAAPDDGEVYCAHRGRDDEDMYYALVPVSPPKRVSGGIYNYTGMYAVDQRSDEVQRYCPLVDPHKPEVRNGYRSVVEEIVVDTLSTMDE